MNGSLVVSRLASGVVTCAYLNAVFQYHNNNPDHHRVAACESDFKIDDRCNFIKNRIRHNKVLSAAQCSRE